MADPLTPAQVELLEEWFTERREELLAQVQAMIDGAIHPVINDAVFFGGRIALRSSKGVTLCLTDGGPAVSEEPVTFQSRTGVGPWESFTVERGQG